MSALFTSVPVDPALKVIKDLLEKDPTLKERTVLPVEDITLLLFLQYINSVDPAIQFTVENNKEDGAIPFLDTIVKPEADGNLSITV